MIALFNVIVVVIHRILALSLTVVEQLFDVPTSGCLLVCHEWCDGSTFDVNEHILSTFNVVEVNTIGNLRTEEHKLVFELLVCINKVEVALSCNQQKHFLCFIINIILQQITVVGSNSSTITSKHEGFFVLTFHSQHI